MYSEGGRLGKEEIGAVLVQKKNIPIMDVEKCLGEVGFGIGDVIDVTVTYI